VFRLEGTRKTYKRFAIVDENCSLISTVPTRKRAITKRLESTLQMQSLIKGELLGVTSKKKLLHWTTCFNISKTVQRIIRVVYYFSLISDITQQK